MDSCVSILEVPERALSANSNLVCFFLHLYSPGVLRAPVSSLRAMPLLLPLEAFSLPKTNPLKLLQIFPIPVLLDNHLKARQQTTKWSSPVMVWVVCGPMRLPCLSGVHLGSTALCPHSTHSVAFPCKNSLPSLAFFSHAKATSIVSICQSVMCNPERPPHQELCWEVQI